MSEIKVLVEMTVDARNYDYDADEFQEFLDNVIRGYEKQFDTSEDCFEIIQVELVNPT